MERIWKELVKIEEEADKIRSEALDKSKEILRIAKEESEKLRLDMETQANEASKELLAKFRNEANKERENALQKNEQFLKELRESAENQMNKALSILQNTGR